MRLTSWLEKGLDWASSDELIALQTRIRSMVDKNIKLEFRHGTDVGQVYIDAGQLESALANLADSALDLTTRELAAIGDWNDVLHDRI